MRQCVSMPMYAGEGFTSNKKIMEFVSIPVVSLKFWDLLQKKASEIVPLALKLINN